MFRMRTYSAKLSMVDINQQLVKKLSRMEINRSIPVAFGSLTARVKTTKTKTKTKTKGTKNTKTGLASTKMVLKTTTSTKNGLASTKILLRERTD